MNTEFLIPISLFAMVFGIVYLAIRMKERKALIEKGLSAEILDSHKRSVVPSSLKWGMLAVGVGLGILIGRILAAYTCLGEEESFFSMIFLFGGFSLILYHFIARKMERDDQLPGA
jgi:hypothetical protein